MTSWGVSGINVNHTAIQTVCNYCAIEQDERERRRKEKERQAAIVWAVFVGIIIIVVAAILLAHFPPTLSRMDPPPAQVGQFKQRPVQPIVAPNNQPVGMPNPEPQAGVERMKSRQLQTSRIRELQGRLHRFKR
jgi:hypothetical protein